jgi:hypothetical protein
MCFVQSVEGAADPLVNGGEEDEGDVTVVEEARLRPGTRTLVLPLVTALLPPAPRFTIGDSRTLGDENDEEDAVELREGERPTALKGAAGELPLLSNVAVMTGGV